MQPRDRHLADLLLPVAAVLCLWVAANVEAAESADAAAETTDLVCLPQRIELQGPGAHQRLIVSGQVEGRQTDVTRSATFRSEATAVVTIGDDGIARAVGDGETRIVVTVGNQTASVNVTVRDSSKLQPVTLEHDVLPVLTRYGCNAGACHGKARGQNGFQLSLFGFDPDFDLDEIVHESRGRRIFPAAPEESLLLQKPTGRVPHGGGLRLDPAGRPYEVLRQWIVAGMPRSPSDEPAIESIEMAPSELIMVPGGKQQVLITARYADGTTEDVTDLAIFQSNESAIAAIDENGLIEAGSLPGEAAVTARFRGLFAIAAVTIPLPGEVPPQLYADLPQNNFIDGHVWTKLEKLGVVPSEPADDATFLRRVYLDVIGRLPDADEARSFLADDSSDKQSRLVEQLLDRPEYADHWANKWVDLLRPNPYRVGIKAVFNLDAWIRDAFRRNIPYDEFVRQIVTARGSTWQPGAATIFRDRREPDEIATMMSQLFLGIRLECAKCHHHPSEAWGQEDFYGFAAYFNRVGRKGTGLSPPISGGEEIVYTMKSAKPVLHPLTSAPVDPKPLFGDAPLSSDPEADPRATLAEWMTSPENDYFSQVIVNRVWADLMGRGIVDPVDDLRATNPPTNGPLLNALAEDFRAHDHDLKHLIRTITTSYVYSLSSTPNERNIADTRNYSRHYRQRLRAESLLGAICDVTEVPERFSAAPPGTRSDAIWTHRVDSLFLDTFGRPDENQDPPCERVPDTSVVQALHLMNSPDLHQKVTSDDGLAARLAASEHTPAKIAEELYLSTYCRQPTAQELAVVEEIYADADQPNERRQVTEDLLWALINTPEFVFKN
ncbi:MAG: DUF1549 and DUF1553 domain-containing protein [Planctomycetaceae bacterium]